MGLENLVPQNLGFLAGIEVREVYRKVREVQKFDFLPGDPIQPPGDRVMSKILKIHKNFLDKKLDPGS